MCYIRAYLGIELAAGGGLGFVRGGAGRTVGESGSGGRGVAVGVGRRAVDRRDWRTRAGGLADGKGSCPD